MASGKYFVLRSHLNGFVVEVKDRNRKPGTAVVVQPQKHSLNDCQLFSMDPTTNTIRSKLNDYCLDMQGSNMVMQPYAPDKVSQQWLVSGFRVQNLAPDNLVLDVFGASMIPGTPVCAWEYLNSANQHWNLDYCKPRYFYVRSRMHNKVLDVSGDSAAQGAAVIMWPQKPTISDNQLWYEDRQGIIRSKLSNFALDASGDNTFRVSEYSASNSRQQWVIDGEKIVNTLNPAEVMDIQGESKKDGAHLCAFQYKGSVNQHWSIEYI